MFDCLKRRKGGGASPRRGTVRTDRGSALFVVMAASAILFITAAAVIGVVVFQQTQQARAQAVMRATGLAHQGMEVYLTALRIDPTYRSRVPLIAGIGEDGTWTVAADVSQNTITAVGCDAKTGLYHVIRATVTNQNFSGYTIISGAPITLGNAMGDINIRGAVRGNASIELRKPFPELTVEYASGRVINSSYAIGTSRVSPIDFARAGSTLPNMYTAASGREAWATSAVPGDFGGQIQSQLIKPLSFYRNPDGRNYWGATVTNQSPTGRGDQPDLVGVGIDFSRAHGADPASGLFYVRSVWAPNISGANKTGAGAPTREQFIEFAKTDPVWNPGRFGEAEWGLYGVPGAPRSYEKTPRGLNPNGNNVIYVGGDYDVYVTGEYSRSVTIVSERNIYIIGNLTRSTDPAASPTATIGLVAKGDIYICGAMPRQSEVATYYASGGATNSYSGQTYIRGAQTDPRSHGEIMGDSVTIEAAMLSINGAIVMDPRFVDPSDPTNPQVRTGTLNIYGSLAAAEGLQGPNFANDYDALYGGFRHVNINYDAQLQDSPPPLFPQLGAGSLKITGWEEWDTRTDPNAGLDFPEPIDYRPEASIPVASTEDTYTPSGLDFEDPMTLSNAKDQYLGQAVITLTAVDTGVGVGVTWYTVDGGDVQYGLTIALPSPPPNTAETHTVDYASVDRDGNREETKTVTFRMVGPDTLPPTCTVVDSRVPTWTIPNGYPGVDDDEYVVYGEFNPVFTAVDNTEGSGAYQIIVIQKNDPQHVSGYDEPDPPAYGSGFNEDLTSPLRYTDIRIVRDTPGFMVRQFEYYAIDAAGNRGEPQTFTIVQHAPDTVPPMTYFDIQQLYIGRAQLHLRGVDDIEGQGVRNTYFSLDGQPWVASTDAITTITVEAPFIGQPQVLHTISFYSVDASPAQNREETQTVAFIVAPPLPDDVTPPVTRTDAVASYVGPAVINLYPEDAGGISTVYWQLDGGDIQEGTRIEIDAPWLGSDPHTLRFWAVDASGNTETPKTVNFVVTPERIAPISAAHNLSLYAGPAVFQITAEDNEGGSGLAAIYYKIDDGPFELGGGMTGLAWVTVTGDGTHTVTFYAQDNALNDEVSKTTTVVIDGTPPTTTDANLGIYTGQATISLTATDGAGSGVKTTYWRNSADGHVHEGTTVLLGPASPTTAGTWDILYWSVDIAGNIETARPMQVVVNPAPDVTPPASYDEITDYYKAPAPASLRLFSWDVQSGVREFYYRLDGGLMQTLAGLENPPATYEVLVGVDGTHTIEYWAIDNDGNLETAHTTKSFVVDTVLPVTACSARQGALYWANQTFVLTASDVGTGIKNTYYTIDGGVPIRGTTIFVPAPTDGYSRAHTIRFWSVDIAGNVESARSVSFTSKPADTIAPKTYSNAVDRYDGASTIILTAFDNLGGSGVAHTYYRIDGGTIIEGTLVGISGSGSHTLEFWSVDVAGNVELPHNTVTYNIDTVAPTTTSDIADLYNAPATIHLTASDNAGGSGLYATYYRLDDGIVATGTAPLTTLIVSTQGPHKLEFWSVDLAGNVETHKVKTFKIDMTPPVTVSNAEASYLGTSTITLIASDEASGSGVAYTRYRLDGGTLQSGTSVLVSAPTSGTVTHTITFWSVDNAGNVESAKSVTFSNAAIANMTFTGMTPTPNTTVTVRNPAVSVIAQCDQRIASVSAIIDGRSVPAILTYGGGYWVSQGYWVDGYWDSDGCSTWWVDPYYVDTSYYVPIDYNRATGSFQASGLLNGPHTVTFTFTNLSGAQAAKTWTFGVNAPADATAPVTVSNAQAFYNATATVSLTATDGVGNTDVAFTYYKLDGGGQMTGTPPITTITVSAAGTHTIEYWSVDGAGNIETHKFSNFIIDNTPPITYSGAPSSYSGTATVYLAPTDNVGGSGVKFTYYRLDGGALSVPTIGSSTIGLWHFEDGGGAVVADSSGNGLTGTLNVGSAGAQTTVAQAWANGTSGRFSKSLAFDGTDDYVNIGSKAALNNLGDTFSVAAWVKTSSNSGTHIIAGRSNDWWLAKSGNAYQFSMWTTTASYYVNATNTSTDWVYVVATYDTSAGQMRLYLNGSLAATAAVTGPTRRGYTQNQIGNGYVWHTGGVYSNDFYWSGQIDEVVISNIARSPEDIKAYYDVTAAANVPPLQLSVLAPLSGPAVSHVVQFYSVDNAGNVESTKSANFSVAMPPDLTPPTTTSNAVAMYSKPTTITLYATDNLGGWGVASTYYKLDNNATQTGTGVSSGLGGSHTLTFWSVDVAGNVEVAKTATYTVMADNTPPVTTCNALSYFQGTAQIALNATDTGWGVAATYYRLDNNATQTGTALSVAPPVAGVVHHVLYYWSVDAAGNVEDVKAAYFDVYAIPYPMVFTGITPPENTFIGTTATTVSVTADADINIISASATLDGQPVTNLVTSPGGGYWVAQGYWVDGYWDTDGCDTWWVDPYYVDTSYWVPQDLSAMTASFRATGLVPGAHTVAVTFTVNNGAQNTKIWTFIVDTIPPTTTSNAQATHVGTATITLAAIDNAGGSGVRNTYYRVESGPVTTGTVITINPPAYGTVTRTISYWSVDNMGNTEPARIQFFEHVANPDLTPPTTTSNVATSYPRPAVISLTATDNVGGWGVRDVYYRLDGGQITTGTAPVTQLDTGLQGLHTLEYWAVDRAGNKETTHTATYTVAPDTTPPTILSNTQPLYIGFADITITATDTADGWGIRDVSYRLDTGTTITVTTPWTVVHVDGPVSGADFHTLSYIATDRAGNQSLTGVATFTVQAAPANIVFSNLTPPKQGATQTINPVVSVFGSGEMTITAVAGTIDGVPYVPIMTYSTVTTGGSTWQTGRATVSSSFVGIEQWDGVMRWGPDWFGYDQPNAKWTCSATFNLANYRNCNLTNTRLDWAYTSAGGGSEDWGERRWIARDDGGWLAVWGFMQTPTSITGVETYVNDRKTSAGSVKFVWDSDYGTYDEYIDDGPWYLESGMNSPTLSFDYAGLVSGVPVTTTDYNKVTAAIPTAGLSQGWHTASFTYTAFNGSTATTSWSFCVDSIPPVTTANNVPTSTIVGGAWISLTADDGPQGSGVNYTYFQMDSNPAQIAQYYGWSVYFAPPTSSIVTRTLTFWSTDRAGNIENQKTVQFRQSPPPDPDPPILWCDVRPYYNAPATIRIGATDSGWGVAHIYYKHDGVTYSVEGTLVAFPILPPGHHVLEYWADDYAGNVTQHFSATYIHDITPPASSSDATATYVGQANIHLYAVDMPGPGVSGVDDIYFKLDGGPTYGYWYPYWYYWNPITVNGPVSGTATHTLEFWAVDNATNVESPHNFVTFAVQAVPADIVWTNMTPAEDSTVTVRNPNVSVTGDATYNITGATGRIDGISRPITLTYSTVTTTTTTWVVSGYNTPGTNGYWDSDGCSTWWVGDWVWVDTSHWETQTYTSTDLTKATALFSTTGLTDGTHTVSFTYTVVGGAQATKTWTFKVKGPDTTPPVTTATYQSSYIGTATVTLVATDDASGVKYTYYRIDNGTQTFGTPPTSTIYVAPPVYGAAVPHTVTFWSVDNNNNTEVQKTISFNVSPAPDIVPPTTTSNAVSMYTGIANISLNATDNPGGWGVAATYYKLDGGITVAGTGIIVNPPQYGSAPHVLQFWSTDRAGNVEIAKTATFTVNALDDLTPPTTSSNAQSVYATPSTITLTAFDAGWGVLATYFTLDGGPVTTGTVIPTGGQNYHVLKFWSVDRKGNVEATKTVAYVVDMTAPVTTSNAGPVYSGVATITLAATDAHAGSSGVRYTYFRVDSGTLTTGTTVTVPGPSGGPGVSHTIQFWSVDYAGNVELAKSATFLVTPPPDTIPPTSTSNVVPFYAMPSTISLTATDNVGGWGVGHIYYVLDGGGQVDAMAPAGPTSVSFGYSASAQTFVVPSGITTIAVTINGAGGGGGGASGDGYDGDGGATGGSSSITYSSVSYVAYGGFGGDGGYWDYRNGDNGGPGGTSTHAGWTPTTGGGAVGGGGAEDGPENGGSGGSGGKLVGILTVTSGSTVTINVGRGGDPGGSGGSGDNGSVSISYKGTGTVGAVPTGGSGPHTLEFWAVDNAGNAETPHHTVTYNVDMTPPTTNSNAQASYVGTATISLTATDNIGGSGLKATYFKVDSGTQTTGTAIVVSPPAFSFVTHSITYWSTDNMGNTEIQKTATFTVSALPDTTAATSLSNAVANYARPTTITITATDNVGGWGVSKIYYRRDGAAPVAGFTAATGGIMTASCQVNPGGAGDHTLEFWTEDWAGNIEGHKTVLYHIDADTTPPVTTSNAVGLYIGAATISLTATDNGGWGVDKTYYKLDGAVQTVGTSIVVTAPIAGSVNHTLEFWSVDLAGNVEATKSVAFIVSGIPANVTFSGMTPADGSIVTTSWANVSVNAVCDQNLSAASMTIDGVTRPATVSIVGKNASVTYNMTGLTDGNHVVSVTVTNATGQQATKTWSFLVAIQTDFTPPTTISNAVLNYIGVANVTLIATDNAGGTGVKATYFKVDGGAQQQGTLITINGPVSGAPVSHTIQFWSVDYANNVETTRSVSFTVAPPDNTAPHSSSDAKQFYNAPSMIQLSATDNTYGSGVAHIYYRLDGGSTVEGTLLGTGGVGTHVLEFWAVDGVGNVESPHNVVTYKVDETSPVTISDAQVSYVGIAYIVLSATDEIGGSGIKGTYYMVDDGWKTAGTTITVTPPTSGAKQHTIYFWSEDRAGNVETTKSATFTVAAPPDTTPPTSSSDARATYALPGLITITAADNVGGWGVDRTYYKLDGGAQTEGTVVKTGAAGSHTLEFWSVDKASNVESPHKFVSYTVTTNDVTPPVTSSDATSTYTGRAVISLTATDNCGIPPVTYYKLDSGALTTGTVVTVLPPRSGGVAHTLYFRSVDINGNSETTKSVSFTVYAQTAAMTFSSISPTEGATVAIRNPIVTVTANSPLPIAEATFEFDTFAKPASVQIVGQVATIAWQATGLTNGGHTVTATFVDSVGAVSVKSWTFTVAATTDGTAPSTSCDAQLYYTGTASVRLYSSDDAGGLGIASTNYRLDGGSTLSGTPPTTTITVSALGQHTLEYWSTDLAGNQELPHKTKTFVIDYIPPTTTDFAEQSYTGPASFNLSATDNLGGSGVKTTYFVVDAGAPQTGTTVNVPAPPVGNQWHTVYYWSVDNAGNSETTKSVTFNVWTPSDLTAPTTVSDAQASYAVPGIIHLTATDNVGGWGVGHTYYILDGGAQTEGTFVGTGGAGTHTLEFWSVDLAGNVETPHKTVTYSVIQSDTTAPTTTSDAQSAYVGPAVLNLSASDGAGSGVAHTYYRIDGGAITEGTMLGVAGAGTHSVEFWSVDWAGNEETPHKTVVFTITMPDTMPPTTTSNALASYTGTATITLTAVDSGIAGVRTTYYRLDGGPVQQGLVVIVSPPIAGQVPHTLEFWSVDNNGNAEGSKAVAFTVGPIPDLVAPTTTSNGVASYTGTATILLTATDSGVAGVKATYFKVDSGAVTTGTTVVVGPPVSGGASHILYYWSVDNQNNVETTKTLTFTVNATTTWTTGTLSFHWSPYEWSSATVYAQSDTGTMYGPYNLEGYETDLWVDGIVVPAGHNYYMYCVDYYDGVYGSSGGGYGIWTGIIQNGQNYVWDY